MNLLFKSPGFGALKVYDNKIEWGAVFKKSIPIKQIAAINAGMPMFGLITVETSGGQKYKVPCYSSKKKQAIEIIYSLMK
ncbi:MAG: hypothetical protein WCP97_00450 [bacterium]